MVDKVKAVGVGGAEKKMGKTWGERERERKKRLFLKLYLTSGTFYVSAMGAGASDSSLRRWMKEDREFGLSFAAVKEAYIQLLEAEADRRGFHGVPRMRFYQGKPIVDPRTGQPLIEFEFSDALLMFRLRGLRPGMYRERVVEERESAVVKMYRGVDVERV